MTKEIILKTVCEILDVEIRAVLQRRQEKGAGQAEYVQARNLYMYFAFVRYKLGSQYSVAGYVNRDHSTLINALNTVSNDNETDPFRRELFLKVEKRLETIEEDSKSERMDFEDMIDFSD